MKNHYLLFVVAGLLLLGPLAHQALAQAPAWQSAVALTPNAGSEVEVLAIAATASGIVYVVGHFRGGVSFRGVSSITTLNSAGGYDAFVAKWTAGGGFQWAERQGGTADEHATAVATSAAGVFVAGTFAGASFSLGNTIVTNYASSSQGTADVWVARLTDTGLNFGWDWAQRAGGTGNDTADGLAVAGSSVYVAGTFNAAIYFGSTAAPAFQFPNAASIRDVFVGKLTDAGTRATWTWATRGGQSSAQGPPAAKTVGGIALGGNRLYVVGSFSGTYAQFGAVQVGSFNGPAGSSDLYVARLTDAGSSGGFTTAIADGDTGNDKATAVAVGFSTGTGSRLYVTGTYSAPTLTLGGTTLANTSGSGSTEVWVAKITDNLLTSPASLSYNWARSGGSTGYDAATALAVSGSNVYVAGTFNGPLARFNGSGAQNGGVLNAGAVGTNDIFVANFLDSGPGPVQPWIVQGGGTGGDYANALALGGATLYVGGSVFPPSSFGTHALTGPANALTGALASLRDPLLGTADGVAAPAFALWPNPARTAVQLSGAPGTVAVLLDALGREVLRQPLAQGAARLDVRGLPAGLYAVRCGGATRRLVVE